MKKEYKLVTNFKFYTKTNKKTHERNGGPDFPNREEEALVLFGFSPKCEYTVQRPTIQVKVSSTVSPEEIVVFAAGTKYAGFTMVCGLSAAVTDYAIAKSFSYTEAGPKLSFHEIMEEAWEQALKVEQAWMREAEFVTQRIFTYQNPVEIDKIGYYFSYKDAIAVDDCKNLKKQILKEVKQEGEIATMLHRAVEAKIQRNNPLLNLIKLVGEGKIHFVVKAEEKHQVEKQTLAPRDKALSYIKNLLIDGCSEEMAIFTMVTLKTLALKKGEPCLYYPRTVEASVKQKKANTHITTLLRLIINKFVPEHPHALQYISIKFLPSLNEKFDSVSEISEASSSSPRSSSRSLCADSSPQLSSSSSDEKELKVSEITEISPSSSPDSSSRSLSSNSSTDGSSHPEKELKVSYELPINAIEEKMKISGTVTEIMKTLVVDNYTDPGIKIEIFNTLILSKNGDTSLKSVSSISPKQVSTETVFDILRALAVDENEIKAETKRKIAQLLPKPVSAMNSHSSSSTDSASLLSFGAFIFSWVSQKSKNSSQPQRPSRISCTML